MKSFFDKSCYSDTYCYGCEGGDTPGAYYYIYEAGGLVSDSTYPYSSYYDVTGTCKSEKDFVITVDEYYTLDSEDSMQAHVLSTGPLSICLDASSWSSYKSGVVSSCGDDVDHCVQAVGINTDEGYWIVRNSWGTSWGVDGYIYLESVRQHVSLRFLSLSSLLEILLM
jgi:C1A family cysteine protease